MIQSYRVENASNSSMPLYTTQGIFVYRDTQLDKQHIVHWLTWVVSWDAAHLKWLQRITIRNLGKRKIQDVKEAGPLLFAGRTFGPNIEKWLVWLLVHPRTRVTSRNVKLSQPTKSRNFRKKFNKIQQEILASGSHHTILGWFLFWWTLKFQLLHGFKLFHFVQRFWKTFCFC